MERCGLKAQANSIIQAGLRVSSLCPAVWLVVGRCIAVTAYKNCCFWCVCLVEGPEVSPACLVRFCSQA